MARELELSGRGSSAEGMRGFPPSLNCILGKCVFSALKWRPCEEFPGKHFLVSNMHFVEKTLNQKEQIWVVWERKKCSRKSTPKGC